MEMSLMEEPGQTMVNITSVKEKDVEPLFFVNFEVNSHKLHALVDSGASLNYILQAAAS